VLGRSFDDHVSLMRERPLVVVAGTPPPAAEVRLRQQLFQEQWDHASTSRWCQQLQLEIEALRAQLQENAALIKSLSAPATAPAVPTPTAHDNAQPASSAATLDSALAAAGLVQHATALRELGCQEAEDLVDLDLEEGDVASIGLSSSDLDRLRDAAAGKAVTCTATAAANPRPSGLEVPSSTPMDAQPEATTTASAIDNAHAAVDTGQELQPNVQSEVATTASADDSARAALMSEEELLAELVRLV
jgi:hypothetical protein